MSAETTLYDTLTASAAVMAYVEVAGSSPAEGRIYPEWVPDKTTPPAIAYQRIGTDYVQTISASGLLGETADFEVLCIATTRTTADALADAVQSALDASGFVLTGRLTQTDFDPELWATLLLVSINTTL